MRVTESVLLFLRELGVASVPLLIVAIEALTLDAIILEISSLPCFEPSNGFPLHLFKKKKIVQTSHHSQHGLI